jgi:hypothetical protein
MLRQYIRPQFAVLISFWLLIVFASPSPAQERPFEKTSVIPAAEIADDEATEILVLGTIHLRDYGDEFNNEALNGLLDVLESFKPDLIAIENMAPYVVRDIVNSGDAYKEITEQFSRANIKFGNKARDHLGISWREANEKAEELVNLISDSDGMQDLAIPRRKLAMLFLATYDLYSAVLQLKYLSPEELADPGDIPKEIHDSLVPMVDIPNENVSIGGALALRLGHQRLYPIDDHRDKEDFIKIADRLNAEFENNEYVKTRPWMTFYREISAVQIEAYDNGDLLPFFQFLNSPESVRRDTDNQWQLVFKANLESGLGRARIAYWEVRNLSIAANIRRAVARFPGGRMLVIIGASHKAFLDAYLNEMMDVRVVQLGDIAP